MSLTVNTVHRWHKIDQTQFYFFTNVFFCQDSYNLKFKWLEFHFLFFFFFSVLWHFDIQGGIVWGGLGRATVLFFFIDFQEYWLIRRLAMYFEEGLAVGWASVCDDRLLYFFYTLARALLFTLLMLSNSHARQLRKNLTFCT